MDDHYYSTEYSVDDDKFVYPNGVLINKLGLNTTQELNAEEIKFTSLRQIELELNPIAGSFDLQHLKAIHKHIFQDVYPWAGETRTVDIGKGDTLFLPYKKIKSVFKKIASDLKKENAFTGLPQAEFANRLGGYLGRINTAHPFREGNGRTQRIFTQEIAKNAGYLLDWSAIGNDAMRNACIAYTAGDTSKLIRLIALNITPIKIEPAAPSF